MCDQIAITQQPFIGQDYSVASDFQLTGERPAGWQRAVQGQVPSQHGTGNVLLDLFLQTLPAVWVEVKQELGKHVYSRV